MRIERECIKPAAAAVILLALASACGRLAWPLLLSAAHRHCIFPADRLFAADKVSMLVRPQSTFSATCAATLVQPGPARAQILHPTRPLFLGAAPLLFFLLSGALFLLAFAVWPRCPLGSGSLLLLAMVAAVTAFGIGLCEEAVRIPPHRHERDTDAAAETLARAADASWQHVEITATDGITLRAWLFSPKAPRGDAVLLLHGLGGTRQQLVAEAQLLLTQHYLVLLPDSRAHGTSEGVLVTYGLLEASDLRCWAEWLCTTQPVRHLYGLGQSLGAAILLQALAQESRFRAVVAEGCFATFPLVACDWVRARLRLPRRLMHLLLWPSVEAGLGYARFRYGLPLRQVSPERALSCSARVPVLLIHGQQDQKIPLEHAWRLRLRDPGQVTLWEVSGAGHSGALRAQPEEFAQRVLSWFAAHSYAAEGSKKQRQAVGQEF